MKPEIWGKYAWNFIHIMTLGYPETPTKKEKKHYYNFFHDLMYVLPCEKCRQNMTEHLKKIPLNDETLSNRNNLVKWGIDLHNIVNYYTGKDMLSYTDSLNEINKLMKPSNYNWNYIYIVSLILILLCIALIIYCYKK
jgi:Erv1 / Alr family